MTSSDPWAGLAYDPRLPQYAHLRSAQRDRDAVSQVLAEAYADGRLDREEFDARANAVASSKTLGELPGFLADLLSPSPSSLPAPYLQPGLTSGSVSHADLHARAVVRYERDRRNAVWTLVWVSTACTGYWALNALGDEGWDPGFYWPVFVILALMLHVGRVVLERRSRIDDEVRRLAAKEQKRAQKLAQRLAAKQQPIDQPSPQPRSLPKQRDDSSPQ